MSHTIASLTDLRSIISNSNLNTLSSALSQPSLIPCTHPGSQCSGSPCSCTINLLATYAAEVKSLQTWCLLFDTHIQPAGQDISWDAIRHVSRRGDEQFATAFQQREPGWANRMEPPSVRHGHQSMTVAKLAVMHGRMEFVRFLVDHCGCDVSSDGRGGELLRMLVNLDIDDGKSQICGRSTSRNADERSQTFVCTV